MTNSATQTIESIKQLDEAKFNKFHLKMIITAGMGFFTDAYDLFVIGVVTAILAPLWGLSATQLAVLNGASLISAAMGALFFGRLSDKFGRKKLYGLEVLILFFGAISSALSPSFIWLLVARVIVGLGIGGDYPTSAVVASESANRKNRGFIVLLVFAMQALGLVIGPLIASCLLATHLSHALIWRVLLGLGAIPAASVFFLRRKMKESPRFLAKDKVPIEVGRVVSDLAGFIDEKPKERQSRKLLSKPWLKYLFGTAGAWFCLDIALYGNGVSSVLIMKNLAPNANLFHHTLTAMLIFLCFAAPGYLLAASLVDKIGRKRMQKMGFAVMAICYLALSLIPNVTHLLPVFVLIFGLSFLFINFGPNATTFLIPAEIYPTNLRASAHGLSAAIGKVGAFIGAFFLPLVLAHYGMSFTMGLMAAVSCIGIALTALVPEKKQQSLDQ